MSEPEARFELATCSLRVSCSTPELPGRGKEMVVAPQPVCVSFRSRY